MNLTEILESVDKEILTEDTLSRLEEAFNSKVDEKVDEKVTLAVESALLEMDEDHSEKLNNLVAAIDEDHTKKLEQVVEAIEVDHTKKLKNVIKKYERELNEGASSHLDHLTEELDRYLEAYVEELIPVALVEQAAKNTYATKVLNEAKTVLSVDEKFANSQFKEAVKDGATQISTLEEENLQLKKKIEASKAKQFLESKVDALPIAKAQFIKKRLAGKPYKFIKENFEFVENMYEEKHDDSSNINNTPRIPTVDRQEGLPAGGEIVTESVDSDSHSDNDSDPAMDFYMDGLTNRY